MSTNNVAHDASQAPTPSSMMAWRVHEFGPPETMQFERVPVPDPGPGEVLIKVHAAGVGPWDGWIRAGRSALPQPLPLTLGSDLSGEVRAVGPDVADRRVGEQVYGVTNPRFIGAYAEYALAAAAMMARKPTSLAYIEAASAPVIAVTAWQGLFDQAQLKAGQTVLIHGAAGNVGAYAVQMASRAGIQIIATAAADDLDYIRELGADTVVDYPSLKTQFSRLEPRNLIPSSGTMLEPQSNTRPLILVVEDEVLVRMTLVDVLEDAGYQVIEAIHADEAISILRALSGVDALITDVEMPQGSMNGIEMAQRVRTVCQEIEIVISSGRATPNVGDLPDRALFIGKPVHPETLVRLLDTLLSSSQV